MVEHNGGPLSELRPMKFIYDLYIYMSQIFIEYQCDSSKFDTRNVDKLIQKNENKRTKKNMQKK